MVPVDDGEDEHLDRKAPLWILTTLAPIIFHVPNNCNHTSMILGKFARRLGFLVAGIDPMALLSAFPLDAMSKLYDKIVRT